MAESTRVVEGRRLAYYGQPGDREYWGQHWKMYGHPPGEETDMSRVLAGRFRRYLPRHGRILEAGCGLGQVVLPLWEWGYDVTGMEWSAETVEYIREARPDIPVSVGDVTSLDVPDGYYDGYISLGVIEHRQDGPAPFLREAHRVLDPDGIAFFSVPYFNALRRGKALFGAFRPGAVAADQDFYQYAFAPGELTAVLAAHGFEVLEWTPYSAIKGIRDEIPAVNALLGLGRRAVELRRSRIRGTGSPNGAPALRKATGAGRMLGRVLERSPFTALGHMALFACRKRSIP